MPIIRPGDTTEGKTYEEYLAGTEAYRAQFREGAEAKIKRARETSARVRRFSPIRGATTKALEARYSRESRRLFGLQSKGLTELEKPIVEQAAREKPIYKGAPAHAGEYEGEVIEKEVERIKQTLKE